MATNFRVKWAKSADSPSFVALAFLNGVKYRNSDFKIFICDNLTTLCKKFGELQSINSGI